MTIPNDLTDRELEREIAHARNRRDAYAAGREPAEVMAELRALLDMQAARRRARAIERAAAVARIGTEPPKPVR